MIVVVGEALIDLLVGADGRVEAAPGGGPFNTARTIARLGRPVAFAGRLSRDAFGRRLRTTLVADGVDTALVEETDDPTTLAVVERAADAETYRFYIDGTSAPGFGQAVAARIESPVALHVGTLGLVMEPIGATIESIVARVPAATLLMADLNARPAAIADRDAWIARVERLLPRIDVLKGSVEDLHAFRPELGAAQAAEAAVASGPRVVLLTDGPASIRIVTATMQMTIEPPPVHVEDTVGAGDAFGGAFLAAWTEAGRGRAELADGAALLAATTFAARVASLTCTRRGADPPTATELMV